MADKETTQSNIFPDKMITRYKRFIRRADSMRTLSELASDVKAAAKDFLLEYPILEESTLPLPD